MITRVVSRTGDVLHDCTALGCDVSWDGKPIKRSAVPAVETVSALEVKRTEGRGTAIVEEVQRGE